MPKRNTLIGICAAILLLITGMILTLNARRIRENQTDPFDHQAYQDAENEYRLLRDERAKLEKINEELRLKTNRLWDDILSENHDPDLISDLRRFKLFAGLIDVQGDGVQIELNDKADYNPISDNVQSLIHDANIRYLVDLLINNGAQAVSINDLRVVNSSYIFCIGTTILCNQERMVPPYVIKAIGPAEKLLEALTNDQLYNKLKQPPYSIRFAYEVKHNLQIKAFKQTDQLDQLTNLLEPVNP